MIVKLTPRSIYGQSKSEEDTEKWLNGVFPKADPLLEGTPDQPKRFRVYYAVHELPQNSGQEEGAKGRFIGGIQLRSLGGPNDLVVPDANMPPASSFTPSTLHLEIGYQFLEPAWGKGYATESVSAAIEACGRALKTEYFKPYDRLYVRAIVNEENPPSLRVMGKTKGMENLGVWEWEGEPVFLAGRWIEKSRICIFGGFWE